MKFYTLTEINSEFGKNYSHFDDMICDLNSFDKFVRLNEFCCLFQLS